HGLGLVEPVLLEQRPAEDDLRVSDLVDEVHASVEQLQRMARLLLRELVLLRTEMNLGERRDRLRGVGVAARLERNRERLLEMSDCVLRLAEQVVEAAEVVEHPTEVDPVAVHL